MSIFMPCSYGGVPTFCIVDWFNVVFTIRSACTVPVAVVFVLLTGIVGVSRRVFLFVFDTVVFGNYFVTASCSIWSNSYGIAVVDPLFVVPAVFCLACS